MKKKISYKVREHSSKKVPIILAIGKNEKADNTVSVRRIGSNNSKVMDLDKAVQEIAKRKYYMIARVFILPIRFYRYFISPYFHQHAGFIQPVQHMQLM